MAYEWKLVSDPQLEHPKQYGCVIGDNKPSLFVSTNIAYIHGYFARIFVNESETFVNEDYFDTEEEAKQWCEEKYEKYFKDKEN